MIKTSLIQKITLSGLFLALTIIFTRILSIQNIPVIPFVRISLGPALIILSSLFLGPISGMIVGAGSDILGIVLFPNSLGYSINPLITLVYGLLGLLPGLLYLLIVKIKSPQKSFISIGITLFLLFVFVTIFLLMNNEIVLFNKSYYFELWQKILIIVLSFVLSIITMICLYFTNKFISKRNDGTINTYSIALICLICELFIMLILNSIVKTIFFEIDFIFIFFAQAIVFFIDIPLNSLVVTYLMLLLSKVVKKRV